MLLYFSIFLLSCLKFGPEKTLSSNLSRFRPKKPVCEPVFVDRLPRPASYFPELSPSGFWRNSWNKTNILFRYPTRQGTFVCALEVLRCRWPAARATAPWQWSLIWTRKSYLSQGRDSPLIT